ncbi:MAG: hypothetical protein P4M01_00910 [Acidobacteriota bacterium]|nr:hypothetical protein [Acidobacteriota bacterium]
MISVSPTYTAQVAAQSEPVKKQPAPQQPAPQAAQTQDHYTPSAGDVDRDGDSR